MAWDPKTYLAFEDQRTRPARELLARVEMDCPARVADLGCGPGNSTALLAARWPQAVVEGFDASHEMLEAARASSVPASWHYADLAQWSPQSRYDVLFSNATLQWLDAHDELLPRLMGYLTAGGTLAVQMPRNFNEASHTLIREVARGTEWMRHFDAVRAAVNVRPPQTYFDILERCAARVDLWETIYVQVLDGEDAVYNWMSGTSLRPFAQALDEPQRSAFLRAYRVALAKAYPQRQSGVTLFPFRRLFLVAKAR